MLCKHLTTYYVNCSAAGAAAAADNDVPAALHCNWQIMERRETMVTA
jgi:hypothetical protein